RAAADGRRGDGQEPRRRDANGAVVHAVEVTGERRAGARAPRYPSVREIEQFAAQAAASRARRAGVVGAGGQAQEFADGQDEADVSGLGVVPDGEGEVEAVGGAAAGGKGAAEAEAGGGAPAGVGAEGRIARPDAAHVGEEGGAEVEHLPERPAEVDPVLDREDGAPAAGEALGGVAAQRVVAAEGELERRAGLPARGGGAPEDCGVARLRGRLPVREAFGFGEDVFPAAVVVVLAGVEAAAAGEQDAGVLAGAVEDEGGEEVVVRAAKAERAADGELRLGAEPDVLDAPHAVVAAAPDPADVALAEEQHEPDVLERFGLRADRGEQRR